MRICVYCGSSGASDSRFRESARTLGEKIGRAGHALVFGGGATGSMGAVADGALLTGAHVIGVMPHFMTQFEDPHPGVKDFIWVETMAARKSALIANANVLVALPGGPGTFEEVVEAISYKRLNRLDEDIYIVNEGGFFDALVQQYERAVQEKFLPPVLPQLFTVVDTIEELLEKLGLDA